MIHLKAVFISISTYGRISFLFLKRTKLVCVYLCIFLSKLSCGQKHTTNVVYLMLSWVCLTWGFVINPVNIYKYIFKVIYIHIYIIYTSYIYVLYLLSWLLQTAYLTFVIYKTPIKIFFIIYGIQKNGTDETICRARIETQT